MSSGVEHYREAERLLALAVDDLSADAPDLAGEKVARAQVHATLALFGGGVASRAYRCIECGAMADTRGDHLPKCSIYVAPWAGTAPDDASGITDVTS